MQKIDPLEGKHKIKINVETSVHLSQPALNSPSEWLNQLAHRQMELQDNLKKALSENEMSVFFQPIVEVATATPVSAQALAR